MTTLETTSKLASYATTIIEKRLEEINTILAKRLNSEVNRPSAIDTMEAIKAVIERS